MNLQEIQLEVEQHPAVTHPLIKRLSHNPNDLAAWRTFARHHHHIVKEFPYHILELFRRLSLEERSKLFPVLADEFPPGVIEWASIGAVFRENIDFSAHAELQLQLCTSLGTTPSAYCLPKVDRFIEAHREIAKVGDIDFVLGMFGPGHEFAIPLIFRQLVSGAPPFVNPRYMFEHLEIDIDHAKRFAQVLEEGVEAGKYKMAQIRAGAMFSLRLRAEAWDDILELIVRGEPE